jgi:hypothetical protein
MNALADGNISLWSVMHLYQYRIKATTNGRITHADP